ncbi:MAG: hypothetical protein ABIJ20_01870 [Nanoarchaeota archaeon]|nr:hypothetical protein [Nanoarchaeota archaeon]MBU1444678.1 hypothetical protein [Nanoarchaeota archaeon]MBU2406414.1 hypothetical protein [Nanoarchaeota archaeon]MBU2420304.1 hypothetical protein [Nanoarchaeota archaeon]MBU2475008.1 hypothetical protein [Nanoarchaeota archaeon]
MNKRVVSYIIITVIIIALIFFAITLFTGVDPISDNDQLARCLTQNGATMYGTEWCSHCKDQKELFGDSFQYVNYVDCDQDKTSCSNAGITDYPTWVINNEKYPGVQQLSKLKELTNC